MTIMTRVSQAAAIALAALVLIPASSARTPVYRIDHVADGDTVVLRNDQRVRLVQIDTPEVYFHLSATGERHRLRPNDCSLLGLLCGFTRSRLPTESTSTGANSGMSCASAEP